MNRNRKPLVVSIIVVMMLLSFAAIYFTGSKKSGQVTLITHDSFVMSKEQIATFNHESGFTLHVIKAGDAGSLTNRLILTKGSPIGDAVFGIDNTFAGVASKNGVIDGALTPTDFGNVCFNYDKNWFASHKVPAPTSINQLTDKKYQGLTVVEDPNLSSTGLSFLATTVDKFGSNYSGYWKSLKANGVKVDSGWDLAYNTDFSGSAGKGKYPIVLSYATSPADEVRDNGQTQTASILDGCFKQTEFAGVLKGAKNPDGAKALISYLLSPAFQATFPESMYMYPIDQNVAIPASWKAHVNLPTRTYGDSLDFATDRKAWLATWSAIFN